nr:beta-eliminating lyase-related protein [Angustibacter aerolatus]
MADAGTLADLTDPITAPPALHDPTWRGFSSDNASGVHPEVLAAVAAANGGHVTAYGDDPYTARLQDVVRRQFGAQAQAFPVFNGTGANVVSLQAVTHRWQSVVCARTAHITVDECAAPEKVGGLKPAHGVRARRQGSRPSWSTSRRSASTTCTGPSRGWSRSPSRPSSAPSTRRPSLRALADHVHSRGLVLHLDGARLSNAAASLGCEPARDHHRRRRRRALLRRHQERCHRRRGRRGAEPGRRGVDRRRRLPAQVLDAGGVEDALRLGPDRRAARGRPVAAQRLARQRHGRAAGRRGARRARPRDHPAGAGQRGVRRAAAAGHRAAAAARVLLHLEPGHRRGALDDDVRHHRGRHRRVRRDGARGDGAWLTASGGCSWPPWRWCCCSPSPAASRRTG